MRAFNDGKLLVKYGQSYLIVQISIVYIVVDKDGQYLCVMVSDDYWRWMIVD